MISRYTIKDFSIENLTLEQQALLSLLHADPISSSAFFKKIDQVVQWENLISLATKHGLLPILIHQVDRSTASTIPQSVRTHFQDVFKVQITRSQRLIKWLIELQQLFNQHEIELITLKGPVLTQRLYGELFLRPLSDLDVLIHPKDFPRCYQLLCQEGYQPAFQMDAQQQRWITRGDREFTFQYQKNILEIHWFIDEPWFFFPLNDQYFWDRLEWVSLSDQKVRALSVENMFLQLCFHGIRHRWERLLWVADLVQFFQQFPDLDWMSFWKWGEKNHFQRIIAMGMILAQELGKVNLPGNLGQEIQADQTAWNLINHSLQNLFSPQGNNQSKKSSYQTAVDELLYLLNTRENLRPKLELIKDRLFVPKQSDWRTSHLPDWGYNFLTLIRPLRLLRNFIKKI
jgi:hypothetical protein